MEDDGKSTSSQDEWIEGREVATVNIEDREVATDIENIEDREVATNDNEPILPVSEYRTVVIRCNSVLTWVIKPLVGLAFIIGTKYYQQKSLKKLFQGLRFFIFFLPFTQK